MPSLPFLKKSVKKSKESPNAQKPTQPTSSPSIPGPYAPPGFNWIVRNGGFALVRTKETPGQQGRETNHPHGTDTESSGSSYSGSIGTSEHGSKPLENGASEDPMAILVDAQRLFQERLSKREAETLRLREERDKLQEKVDLLKTTIDALREENNTLKLSLDKKKEENESVMKVSRRVTTDFLEEMERIHSGPSSMGSSKGVGHK